MALDLLLPRRKLNGNSAEESLAEFVRRRLGTEALERMAQPMVGGIYTADPERLSLQATMPRFLEMEREHSSVIRALRKQNSRTVSEDAAAETSGARYSLFSPSTAACKCSRIHSKKEFQVSDLRSPTGAASGQASIRVNTAVESITLEYGDGERSPKWKLRTSGDETLFADAICLALPAYISSRLLGTVDPQLAAELAEISYASSATINLGFKRDDIPHPLDGFGFVVPFIEKQSLIACTFSSVKFAGRAPHGHALLRAFVGGALQPELRGAEWR